LTGDKNILVKSDSDSWQQPKVAVEYFLINDPNLESFDMELYLTKSKEIIADSVAKSSKAQYDRCWQIFQTFCEWHSVETYGKCIKIVYRIQHGLNDAELIIPDCKVDDVLAYLAYIHTNYSDGVSNAYTHVSAIAFNYRAKGKVSPTDDHRVTMNMKGLKRRNLGKKVNRAKPMTLDVLEALRKMLKDKPNLVRWRTIWGIHMEFFLMLGYIII